MSDISRFVIGECDTAKAIHVLHLSECARRYGSDKKTKRLVGLVVTDVNIPTATGRASWFFRVRFHIGGGQTKLHKLSVRSVEKALTPVMHEEEHEIPEEKEIHDAVPIYERLRVDTIAVQVDEDEIQAPNNEGEAPTHIVPNPDQTIQPPVPHNNEEVAETQPVIPAEDELLQLLQPMPIFPYHTALFPVPPVPNPAPTDCRSDTVYKPLIQLVQV